MTDSIKLLQTFLNVHNITLNMHKCLKLMFFSITLSIIFQAFTPCFSSLNLNYQNIQNETVTKFLKHCESLNKLKKNIYIYTTWRQCDFVCSVSKRLISHKGKALKNSSELIYQRRY